jgi:hypothetical protein
MSRSIPIVTLTVLSSLTGFCALAQTQAASAEERELDKEVALLRQDLRSEKKQTIAANLTVTAREAERFGRYTPSMRTKSRS